MAKDPVCGMDVDEKTTTLKSDYIGKDLLLLYSKLQANV